MHTTDPQQRTELTRRYEETLAKLAELTGQIKAAVRREADLKQQLNATQAEMNKLGFMQLGKKMMVKAEQDNLRKKLTANQQLQESLLAKQQAFHEQQTALEKQLAALRDAESTPAPAPEAAPAEAPAVQAEAPAEAPAAQAEAAPAEAPAVQEEVPAPAREPRRAPKAPAAPRAPRLDPALSPEEQLRLLLPRLEAFYPEKQVFALDSICSELSGKLNALVPRCGCASLAELLAPHGFRIITGVQGRALRQGKYCTPGQEPEIIRPLIASVQRRLEKHYPDRGITRSIQHDHKSLAQDVTSLYQFLGYGSAKELLTALGYRYEVSAGGRPATDPQAIFEALRAAYADGERPATISRLMADHPELAHSLKTLQNQSPARFGMPLRQYLCEMGILSGKSGRDA
ncbi:MAG: hypothetical protein E7327_08255 [Clostridiales bacterium]|nr:hypothetical protein [Clostridiales bacterium]